jgi:GT2 family glycosyltransferase
MTLCEYAARRDEDPCVYILILNWNGWKDTIECLENVFRLDYKNYRVVLCDNNSSDSSLEYIKAWADGRLNSYLAPGNPSRHLSFPPLPKPIPYQVYDPNGDKSCEVVDSTADCRLILIQTGSNRGFAGGNNVGLRYVLARNNFEYVWILNNDAVTDPGALTALVEKADQYRLDSVKVGIIGSKLMHYYNPRVIQTLGGLYNKWFGTVRGIGASELDQGQYDFDEMVRKADYVAGASMFVVKEFIQDVGLMCEDYFIYYEEIDWTLRGKKRNWQLGYCWKAKVFHKEGGTIGSSSKGSNKSEISDYYGLKNRIVVSKKFYPEFLWTVRLGFGVVLCNRMRRWQFRRFELVVKAFLGRALL